MDAPALGRNLRPGGSLRHKSSILAKGDKPWTCDGVAPEPLCAFNLFAAPPTPRLMSQLPLKDGNFVEDADLDTEPGGDGCF